MNHKLTPESNRANLGSSLRLCDRRVFLQGSTLVIVAAGASVAGAAAIPHPSGRSAEQEAPETLLRIGLVTDLHYADKPPAGSRHYRQTPQKLAEATAEFQQAKIDCLIELGDLIDAAADVATEQRYLKKINQQFSAICQDRHYVLGNHCVDTLRKAEFLGTVEQEKSYYSFERGGFHFIVLDSCFRSDGVPYERKNFKWTDANIPAAELDWLQADLQGSEKPVIVFAHQRLDVDNSHGVKNQAEVRQLLEASGRVQAVFQGHSHKNDLQLINGIAYCTLVAMVEGAGVENNGYSVLEIAADQTLRVQGFRQQKDYQTFARS